MSNGSSPLTRGKLDTHDRRNLIDGLIPAHAGKTGEGLSAVWAVGAHPRSRGENSISGLIVDRATGSSPLTRGKPPPLLGRLAASGLIPAHAGKT